MVLWSRVTSLVAAAMIALNTSTRSRCLGIPLGGEGSPVNLEWATPIYAAPLWSSESEEEIMNSQLIRVVQRIESSVESTRKSNVGGYQSPVYNAFNPHNDPVLRQLETKIIEAATQFYLMGLDPSQTSDGGARQQAFIDGQGGALELFSLWVNVNRANDYNNAHIHSDCFMSGAYYITTGRPKNDPDGAAAIVFNDPRGQPGTSYDFADWWGMSRNFFIEPKPGMIALFPSWVLHRVEAVNPDEDVRISISFNIRMKAPVVAPPLASSANLGRLDPGTYSLSNNRLQREQVCAPGDSSCAQP